MPHLPMWQMTCSFTSHSHSCVSYTDPFMCQTCHFSRFICPMIHSCVRHATPHDVANAIYIHVTQSFMRKLYRSIHVSDMPLLTIHPCVRHATRQAISIYIYINIHLYAYTCRVHGQLPRSSHHLRRELPPSKVCV